MTLIYGRRIFNYPEYSRVKDNKGELKEFRIKTGILTYSTYQPNSTYLPNRRIGRVKLATNFPGPLQRYIIGNLGVVLAY